MHPMLLQQETEVHHHTLAMLDGREW